MKGDRRILLLAAAAALVLVIATAPVLTGDGSDGAEEDLTERYPYADYIISDSGRSTVTITYKTPVEDSGQDQESPGTEWSVRTVSYGASHELTLLSGLSQSLTVVMTGGVLETLTLIGADVVKGVDPVDVRFEMYGGDISQLKVLSVHDDLKGSLGTRYTFMFAPLGSVDLVLESGHIGCLVPTEDMVSVSVMSVEVSSGMSIDRMMTSGVNGRYEAVHVSLTGGTVGYMANVRSVVGDLTYDLRLGTVEFLCIGADTEYGDTASQSDLNTFYVQHDVSLSIDTSVSVRLAIVGGGITSIPSMLWNGDVVTPPVAKNILIDAPGTVIYPDVCFMTSNRTLNTAYDFTSYRIGGTPRTQAVSSSFVSSDGTASLPVYGADGIWESPKNMCVPTGYSIFMDAQFTVPSSSWLTVMPGGSLVTSNSIVLYGTLDNRGDLVNNGLIEKRESGTYIGDDPGGDGFLAYCISLDADGRIDVMASDDDTVLLRMESFVYISGISVLLDGADMEVVITAPSSIYIGGDLFMISLREREVEGFDAAYELTIEGIDPSVLSYLEIAVTVPTPTYRDYYVYHQDDLSDPMEVYDGDGVSYGEMTFYADGTGVYVLSTLAPDGTEEPLPEPARADDGMTNVILALAIVIVGSAVVYILLRK